MNLNTKEELSKQERQELNRLENLKQRESAKRKAILKKTRNWVFGLAAVLIPIGGLIWFLVSRPPIPESEIASKNGLHWHPTLSIKVAGVEQKFPTSLGISGSFMAPIHTHEPDGVIHLEFTGLVKNEDIKLKRFFKNWGKDMNSFGTITSMTVNGVENKEYGEYIMKDKDKIELRYE